MDSCEWKQFSIAGGALICMVVSASAGTTFDAAGKGTGTNTSVDHEITTDLTVAMGENIYKSTTTTDPRIR